MPSANQPFEWFAEARFGLFIHWGIYALIGREAQVLFRERLNPGQYRKLAHRFNPRRFDADDWARQARKAGMRYAVLTTKHCDGFCLFDSRLTDYTAARTGAGRDLVAEYVRAMRRHGLRVGLYFSLCDWSWPAYFRGAKKDPSGFAEFLQFVHGQVRELCSNYGQIDVLWFDGGWPYDAAVWQSEKLDRLIRRLQPHVMINDRLHGGGFGNVIPVGNASRRTHGYFNTFEQRAVDGNGANRRPNEMAETSQDTSWGYHRGDRCWKTPRQIVKLLATAAASDANLLLNVGPTTAGRFPSPFRRILRETGRWLKVNGEAFFGVTGVRGPDLSTVGSLGTGKRGRLYIHAFYWPGTQFHVHGLANQVTGVRILGSRHPVQFTQRGLDLYLSNLPRCSPDPSCAVIRLDLKGYPKRHPSVIHLFENRGDPATLVKWAERS